MGYSGERVEVKPLLDELCRLAKKEGFTIETLMETEGFPIYAFSREGVSGAPPIYLSAGIHGDEPAGPVAVSELLKTGLPNDISWKICPVLNPAGLHASRRENASGVDLNRDYNHPTQPETKAHIEWLKRQSRFELALLLHEDWETSGFYLYEAGPPQKAEKAQKGLTLGRKMLDAVEPHCPIEKASLIEGLPAINGLIIPEPEAFQREDWPEAFYLLMNQNQVNYTLEAPSSLDLETRVTALKAAVRAASSTLISGRLQG